MSENGGIGRHARLRTLWPLGCGGSTPPSRTLLFFLFVQFFSVQGCSTSPENIAIQSLERYSAGDVEGFCALLTPDSASWFRGLLALNTGAIFLPGFDNEINIRLEQVDLVADGFREKQEDGSFKNRDFAVVTVDLDGDSLTIPLIRLREGWRIDLFSLADVWKRAAERALPPL